MGFGEDEPMEATNDDFEINYNQGRATPVSPRTLREFFDKCEAEFEKDEEQLRRTHNEKIKLRQGRWD